MPLQILLILTCHFSEGVNNAAWDATYDIYVKTDTKEKPVTFIYKAAIQQSTGEVRMICSLSSIHPHINLNFRHGTTFL
jgi:hypothetical protein